ADAGADDRGGPEQARRRPGRTADGRAPRACAKGRAHWHQPQCRARPHQPVRALRLPFRRGEGRDRDDEGVLVVQGLELSRRFYEEAVRPILERDFPEFVHAAALIGYGSDVLGFDDETSRDHEWGPRVQLFARESIRKDDVEARLARELPTMIAGFPTHFGPTEAEGVNGLAAVETGPIAHRVQVLVLSEYVDEWIGVDPLSGFTTADWLVTPAQRLLELTAGEVFADPIGDLTRLRELLAFYPLDVWLYVMAGHWERVGAYEHFLGRTGSRGDEPGSRLLAATLVRDLMQLAFLQERRYPPYAKWLGTAYATLGRPEQRALEAALAAPDWQTREDALVSAYEDVARSHNELHV